MSDMGIADILSRINWWSVWLAVLTVFLIKVCWYSDFAFGDFILKRHIQDENMWVSVKMSLYFIGTIVELGFIVIGAFVFCWLGINGFLEGALFGLLSFMVMLVVLVMLCFYESRILDALLIHGGYLFCINLTVGLLLGCLK
jgi:hypothetical protein